jgi:DNA-binding XRE family transcriptional regulator
MQAATLIKQARAKKGWTQAQLADAIGVTAGFITKVEMEQALPSYERCIALSSVLGLSLDDLWAQVEAARAETLQQRIRTRGAALRGAVRTRGGTGGPSSTPPAPEMTAADIARDIAAHPELQAAYRDLKTALADPQMRDTVLNALRAFAQAARQADES